MVVWWCIGMASLPILMTCGILMNSLFMNDLMMDCFLLGHVSFSLPTVPSLSDSVSPTLLVGIVLLFIRQMEMPACQLNKMTVVAFYTRTENSTGSIILYWWSFFF